MKFLILLPWIIFLISFIFEALFLNSLYLSLYFFSFSFLIRKLFSLALFISFSKNTDLTNIYLDQYFSYFSEKGKIFLLKTPDFQKSFFFEPGVKQSRNLQMYFWKIFQKIHFSYVNQSVFYYLKTENDSLEKFIKTTTLNSCIIVVTFVCLNHVNYIFSSFFFLLLGLIYLTFSGIFEIKPNENYRILEVVLSFSANFKQQIKTNFSSETDFPEDFERSSKDFSTEHLKKMRLLDLYEDLNSSNEKKIENEKEILEILCFFEEKSLSLNEKEIFSRVSTLKSIWFEEQWFTKKINHNTFVYSSKNQDS